MKIHIHNIPKDGLKLEENLSLESLNTRMNEGSGNDIEFTTAPFIKLIVKESIQCIELSGSLETKYTQGCGTCLDPIPQELKFDFYILLKEEKEKENSSEDSEIIFYTSPVVDIESYLQEQIILSISPFLQPEKDDDGKCKLCLRSVKELLAQEAVDDTSVKKPFANLQEIIDKKKIH